ncbi:phosphoribosylglycinamide synthetase C domain-containing protein, partial [Microbacterium sp. UBA1097]
TGTDAAASIEGVHLAHAATAHGPEGLVATGGRVLNVVATGENFAQARARAYEALLRITLEGGQFRTDIAASVG